MHVVSRARCARAPVDFFFWRVGRRADGRTSGQGVWWVWVGAAHRCWIEMCLLNCSVMHPKHCTELQTSENHTPPFCSTILPHPNDLWFQVGLLKSEGMAAQFKVERRPARGEVKLGDTIRCIECVLMCEMDV